MQPAILALALLMNPDLMLLQAKADVRQEAYYSALPLLKMVSHRRITDKCALQYALAVSAFMANDKKTASAACEYVLSDFGEVPLRYKQVCIIMLEDMETWKENDLSHIKRKMRSVSQRLANANGGKTTRAQQKSILDDLDKLIKQAEDDKQKAEDKANGQSQKGEPVKGQGESQGGTPKADSDLPSGIGKGEVDPKRIREIADVWGKLPEKERAKALIELTRDMPARYRDAIESYLKNISAKSGSK